MWSWNCWVFLPRFTLLQGCPPQSSLLIPTNSLHPGSSLRSHARFHVRLVRMFVTDCFCFSVRCNRFDLGHFFLLFFFFIYETSCQLRVEWARLLDTRTRPVWRSFSFCWHQKPLKWWWEKSSLPAASQNDQKGNTYRGPSDTQRRTDRRTLAHVFKENTVGQTTPEKVVRVWSLHLLLIKVSV